VRESGRVEVEGAQLAFEHEPEGAGATLVLLHAGICDQRLWDGVVERLHGRPWLRYDLRGFGRSTLPDAAYEPYRDLLGLLGARGIDRAALCGVSFGGGVAIDAAIGAPDRVAALIGVCTGPFGREWPDDLMAQAEEADRAAEAGDVERAIELELRMWVDGPQRGPDAVDPALRELARDMNRAAWRAGNGGEGVELQPLAVGRLGEIRAPTLVIDGELDQPHSRHGCRLLADGVPGARYVLMPGVAHLPPLEQPEAFVREVAGFLAAAGL
jgi:3-oxoadipate enol-lactonase